MLDVLWRSRKFGDALSSKRRVPPPRIVRTRCYWRPPCSSTPLSPRLTVIWRTSSVGARKAAGSDDVLVNGGVDIAR